MNDIQNVSTFVLRNLYDYNILTQERSKTINNNYTPIYLVQQDDALLIKKKISTRKLHIYIQPKSNTLKTFYIWT